MIHARTLAPRVLTTSAMLAAALILAGCSSTPAPGPGAGNDAGTPVSGGTLVYASGDAEPSCLDPHVGGNYPQALVSSQYLETLYTNGPAGGGGASKSVRQVVAVASLLLPREAVKPRIEE